MKTLRLLRNISALFILAVMLLGSRPSSALPMDKSKGCGNWICLPLPNTNCVVNNSGTGCKTYKCQAGEPCSNTACGSLCNL